MTPELEPERRWALQLLEHSLDEVREEAKCNHTEALLEDIKGLIGLNTATTNHDEPSVEEIDGEIRNLFGVVENPYTSLLGAVIDFSPTALPASNFGLGRSRVQQDFALICLRLLPVVVPQNEEGLLFDTLAGNEALAIEAVLDAGQQALGRTEVH